MHNSEHSAISNLKILLKLLVWKLPEKLIIGFSFHSDTTTWSNPRARDCNFRTSNRKIEFVLDEENLGMQIVSYA